MQFNVAGFIHKSNYKGIRWGALGEISLFRGQVNLLRVFGEPVEQRMRKTVRHTGDVG